MQLWRTQKGRDELRPGIRNLPQRERALLLLADGGRPLAQLTALIGSDAGELAQALVREGYLALQDPAAETPALRTATAADRFGGRRSLAATRMFLFDLGERMFARRDPLLAQRLRNGLREARDEAAMRAVADVLLQEVERAAGAQRAAAIRQRIDLLAPENTATTLP